MWTAKYSFFCCLFWNSKLNRDHKVSSFKKNSHAFYWETNLCYKGWKNRNLTTSKAVGTPQKKQACATKKKRSRICLPASEVCHFCHLHQIFSLQNTHKSAQFKSNFRRLINKKMHWINVSSLASWKEHGAAELRGQQAFHLPLLMDQKTSVFCWKAVNPNTKRLSNGARTTRLAVASRLHGHWYRDSQDESHRVCWLKWDP